MSAGSHCGCACVRGHGEQMARHGNRSGLGASTHLSSQASLRWPLCLPDDTRRDWQISCIYGYSSPWLQESRVWHYMHWRLKQRWASWICCPVVTGLRTPRFEPALCNAQGLSEPVGALIALLFVKPFLTPMLLQYMLAFVGGIMVSPS